MQPRGLLFRDHGSDEGLLVLGVPHPERSRSLDQLLAQGRAVAWEDKIPLATFTGNMMGAIRKRMYDMAAGEHKDLMFVNEVFIKAADQAKDSCLDITEPQPRKGGAAWPALSSTAD